jgi:ribonuclease HII
MALPDFSFEKKLAKKGCQFIGGVDEVGRGCFAGPLVAGCVVFLPLGSSKPFGVLPRRSPAASHPFAVSEGVVINDSKKLTSKQRERADSWIRENSMGFGIGRASVAQINRLGIKKASEIAFRKAIKAAGRVDYLLIDAFYIPYVRGLRRKNQKPIIKGDTKSVSIAAASIIAKVYRDKLMQDLGRRPKYQKYGWERNKGYGTREHRAAIKKYGATRQHRKQWIETWQKNLKSKP